MSKKISSMGASAPSRSRASINRKQGGGNKLSGLPSNTNKTSLSSNINKNKSWMAPRRKDLIFCVNQLGGIGRSRSQFSGSSSDGVKDCVDSIIPSSDSDEIVTEQTVEFNGFVLNK